MATAVLLSFPAVSFGWTVTNPDLDVIRITRDASDTGSAVFELYTSTTANPSPNSLLAGTYDETGTGTYYTGAATPISIDASNAVTGFNVTTIVPTANMVLVVGPGGKRQMVLLKTRQQALAVPVTINNTPSVSILGTVPVSQSASLSVAGTLPVDVVSAFGGQSGFWLVVAFAALVVMGVTLYASRRG